MHTLPWHGSFLIYQPGQKLEQRQEKARAPKPKHTPMTLQQLPEVGLQIFTLEPQPKVPSHVVSCDPHFRTCCWMSACLFSHPPGSKSPKEQSTFQKLVHINTTALLEHPDYKGPFLPASAVALSPSSSSKKMTPLQKELQETLKTLLGSTDQGSLEVVTQYGWVLGKGSLLLGKGLKLTGLLSKPCMAQQGPGEAPAPSAYLCVHCGVSKASLQVLIPPPAPVLPQMQRCS